MLTVEDMHGHVTYDVQYYVSHSLTRIGSRAYTYITSNVWDMHLILVSVAIILVHVWMPTNLISHDTHHVSIQKVRR